MAKVKLGDRARDTITGFEGIATAHIKYLTGCDQLGIRPTTLSKDGLPIDIQWFDEMRLEKVRERAVKPQGEGVG